MRQRRASRGLARVLLTSGIAPLSAVPASQTDPTRLFGEQVVAYRLGKAAAWVRFPEQALVVKLNPLTLNSIR